MSKSSQLSFASRIGKAETLYNTVSGFTAFDPGDDALTAIGIRALIANLYALQETHAARYNAFTTAVLARQNLFNGEKSLGKTMTMAKNYVTALYGKRSDKAKNVNAIVLKMRGEKPVRFTTASGESTISRSERSYGAQHVNLLYLISTLSSFGPEYAPANPAFTIEALTTLAEKIKSANDEAVLSYQAYRPLIAGRKEAFIALAAQVQRIKQMVLAQYGSGSLEYKSIKGLKF